MGKEVKTNAVRILERNKVPYELLTYECDEFIDGIHSAEATGTPVAQTYKTLVMQGKSKKYYVFVIPIAEEVDLKAAARAVSEKSVEMIHVKDLTAITGYVRGGCSPLGMKKAFPTVIDASARQYSEIYVSGGRIGTSIRLDPQDLARIVRAGSMPPVSGNGRSPAPFAKPRFQRSPLLRSSFCSFLGAPFVCSCKQIFMQA